MGQQPSTMLPSENLRAVAELMGALAKKFSPDNDYRSLPEDAEHAVGLLYMLDAAEILRTCGFPDCDETLLAHELTTRFRIALKKGHAQYFQNLRSLLGRDEYQEHVLSLISKNH